MKTNHQRGFVAKPCRDQTMFATGATGPLSGKTVGASIGTEFTDGHRGMARAKRGAKKYVRSRIRHHENAATRTLVDDPEDRRI